MLKEFKDFALKGNVVDLAVAVIIGGAFGKIIDSLVNDIIMPLIGAITGGVDFSNLYASLNKTVIPAGAALVDARKVAGANVLAYGNFITFVINCLIVAFVLFMMVRAMNSLKKKEVIAPAAPPAPPREEVLLEQIRDLLAKR